MTKQLGPREKFFALNGLVCLVQSLEGKYTTVDLRNESSVYGRIEDVDVFMNISMSAAVFINGKGEKYKFDNFFIQARNVRYVHIPDEVPIIGAIERQLGKIINPGRGKSFKEREKSFKVRRAAKKQQETLAMIGKMKEERLKKEREEKEKN
ncbi:U7 snRNA-associated Sm-like protein LSm10 [Homalodisca vitripennis]|uniref:Sm domain-containing protein n=1 Tax=Homalodisca liturata TaxID=320908 RepID=A0A1B6IFG4_9HEMI|nr:U7 snRNA-associated Sm-like protein LSm10 [Homalodisca vitripennis]XP_046669398.1 U7 snRNA-associated Sm-like protein LSm10 [Homalodisca vitripennis]KAG8298522.1 LSM domain [Homalodisca vitripennis]